MYHPQGDMQKALQGDIDFSIREILTEAWHHTQGAKLIFFGALFVIAIILGIIKVIFGALFNLSAYQHEGAELQKLLAEMGVNILSLPIEAPLMAALMMMALKHLHGHPIHLRQLFDYFVYVWPLVFVSIFMYVALFLGFLLLLLPGIYLSVSYVFVYQLMIDKKLGIWEAMETSRKAVTRRWFHVFGLMLANGIIVIISAVPLLIGLFWTLPMAALSMGILYTRLFGYDGATEAA